MLRAVVDTSVLVAAFAGPPDGDAARLLEQHGAGAFELVASPRLIAELDGVLRRPAFAAAAADERAELFVDRLAASALFVDDAYDPPRATADRSHDSLAATARAGAAGFIVTADPSLLRSHVRGVSIVSPADFTAALERLGV